MTRIVHPTAAQLQTLCDITQAAGQAIMEVYGQQVDTWSKDDASPLTEADLRADRIIRQGLEVAFPGVFIWSEESRSAGTTLPETFFLVDPLDGTKEFLKRNGEFTVNIAWVHQGVVQAGVVQAPALGELFYAAHGLGAWQHNSTQGTQALHTHRVSRGADLRIMGSRSHTDPNLQHWLGTLTQGHTFVPAGSSLKFCRLAQGQADVYPRLAPTSQWDTAAGQCVLEAAGGCVRDLAGHDLRYGLDRTVLNPYFIASGDPALADQLPPVQLVTP